MFRWTGMAVCVIILLALVRAQAQQSTAEMKDSEATYPDSSEGLQKQLQDTVEAVKAKDSTKETTMIHSLIMPGDSTWFSDEFGPAFRPRLSAAYQRISQMQQILTRKAGYNQRSFATTTPPLWTHPTTIF